LLLVVLLLWRSSTGTQMMGPASVLDTQCSCACFSNRPTVLCGGFWLRSHTALLSAAPGALLSVMSGVASKLMMLKSCFPFISKCRALEKSTCSAGVDRACPRHGAACVQCCCCCCVPGRKEMAFVTGHPMRLNFLQVYCIFLQSYR
jgi:hypothetical protein